MTTGKKLVPKGMRVWPAVVAPLGLTMLLLVALWLFSANVRADQEHADAVALRLEGYARLEAGELTSRARTLANAFVDDCLKKRAAQERDMRIELRGVMDAVYRVLTAGLEKTRSAASVHRDVGEFPSGFESLRLFLELADDRSASEDAPVAALRACVPELTALLPPGCALTVVENNFEELLSLGGGNVPENARTETIAREFIWDGGSQSRHWTLQVRLSEADATPLPDARQLAAHLDSRMGTASLVDASWRGWLIDQNGQAAAGFPSLPEDRRTDSAPPFIDMPGEWVEIDGKRLVWLERGNKLDNAPLSPGIAVSIDRPPPALVWTEELAKDKRWGLTLGLLGLLALGTWLWFLRALWVSRRRSASRQLEELLANRPQNAERRQTAQIPRNGERPSMLKGTAAAMAGGVAGGAIIGEGLEAPRRRLVRDGAPRATGDVIIADIGDDGEVEVGAEVIRRKPRERVEIPSGSLFRLQERHRGGKGRSSSRVLDQAKSQLVRELAKRVRPVLMSDPSAPPPPPPPPDETDPSVRAVTRPGRSTERIMPKK